MLESEDEEIETSPEARANTTAVHGRKREFELPQSAYTIQIVDFQPFLCDIS